MAKETRKHTNIHTIFTYKHFDKTDNSFYDHILQPGIMFTGRISCCSSILAIANWYLYLGVNTKISDFLGKNTCDSTVVWCLIRGNVFQFNTKANRFHLYSCYPLKQSKEYLQYYKWYYRNPINMVSYFVDLCSTKMSSFV